MKHRMFMVLILLLLSAILVAPVAAQDIVTNTPRSDTAVIVSEEPAATEVVTPVPTVVPEADGKLLTEFIAWAKDTTSSALDRFTDMSRWFVVAFILLALVALRAVYTSVPIKYQRQIKQGALDVMDGVELKVSEGVIAARNTPDPADDMYMAGLQLLTAKVDALIKLLPAPPDQPQQGRIHPLFAILLGALLLISAIGYAAAQPRASVQLLQNISFEQAATNGMPDVWQGKNLTAKDTQICYTPEDNQAVTGFCVMTLKAETAKKVLYQDTGAIAEGTHDIVFQAVVKGYNVQPGALKLVAKFYAGGVVVDKRVLDTKDGTYPWYDNVKGGVTAPAGGFEKARVLVILKPGSAGKVWLDAFNMSGALPE